MVMYIGNFYLTNDFAGFGLCSLKIEFLEEIWQKSGKNE